LVLSWCDYGGSDYGWQVADVVAHRLLLLLLLLLLQARPNVQLHVLGSSLDGRDMHMLQVRCL
jgi:hypothetical protein